MFSPLPVLPFFKKINVAILDRKYIEFHLLKVHSIEERKNSCSYYAYYIYVLEFICGTLYINLQLTLIIINYYYYEKF